jgi:hypothetical protein
LADATVSACSTRTKKRLPWSVIPAEAGIQVFQSRNTRDWTPAFAGATTRGGWNVLESTTLRCQPENTMDTKKA